MPLNVSRSSTPGPVPRLDAFDNTERRLHQVTEEIRKMDVEHRELLQTFLDA
jgi:hypothetical protein